MSFNFTAFNTEKYDKYLSDFDFSKVDYTDTKDVSVFDNGDDDGVRTNKENSIFDE